MKTTVERIPIAGPWITDKEVEYVADAARNAWYAGANVWHERFEAAMAEHCRRKFAIALPSCTSALHLALAGSGIGEGDEVVVADVTWIATAAPISYVGATPVFGDIGRDSWCLEADGLEACITPKTKAAIVVDLYGNMPDMGKLEALCERRGIRLIEDSAESIGSVWGGRPAGNFGLASTFSFHGSKTITTGEGGMLLTDDPELRARCLFLRDHGRLPGDRMFFNAEVAFKYKMSSLQAALGTAQVERIGEIVARKRRIFGWYRDRLAGTPGIALNPEPAGGVNQYWMVTAVWDERYPIEKAAVMDALAVEGIDTRPFFHPLSSLPAYAGHPQAAAARARNRVAYELSPRGINLPSALALTESQVDRAARAFLTALSSAPQ